MDEVKDKKLVVADICNTLYDSNTTFDFIRFCVEKGKIKRDTSLYKFSLSRKSPLYWFWVVMQRLTKYDYQKAIAISLFKNESEHTVRKWAGEFYDSWLSGKMISQTIGILEQYKNDNVVLVSSTIEPVAKIISEKLGVPSYLATILEINGGKYSGRISKELSGNKLKALAHNFATREFIIDVVITDNFTDMELMGHSREKIAVCYNQQQEKFWGSLPGVHILQMNGL